MATATVVFEGLAANVEVVGFQTVCQKYGADVTVVKISDFVLQAVVEGDEDVVEAIVEAV